MLIGVRGIIPKKTVFDAPGPIPMDPDRDYVKFPATDAQNGGI